MIRIMTEAKADFDRLIDIMADYFFEGSPYAVMGMDDQREMFVKHSEKLIDNFKRIRGQLPSPENDITYWGRQIKENGFDAVKQFEKLVTKFEEENEAKKEFRKRFPSSIVRKFERSKEMLSDISTQNGIKASEYSYWIGMLNAWGYEETVGELRRLLKEKVGYDDEEKSEIEKGSEVVCERDGWIIYRITNYIASEYYGQGTGWCISGNYPGHENRGRQHFEDYIKDTNPYGYFFLINGNHKFCFFYEAEKGIEIWDGTDGNDRLINFLPNEVPDGIVDDFNDIYDFSGTCNQLRKKVIPATEDGQIEMISEYCANNSYARVLINTHLSFEKFIDEYIRICQNGDEDSLYETVIENEIKSGDEFAHFLFCTAIQAQSGKTVNYVEFHNASSSQKEQYLLQNKDVIKEWAYENYDSLAHFLMCLVKGDIKNPTATSIERALSFLSLEPLTIAEVTVGAGFGRYICNYIIYGDRNPHLIDRQ